MICTACTLESRGLRADLTCERCRMREQIATLTAQLTASQSALTKARGQVAEAVTFLRDMSCDGCEYGDDCPSTGTNHYVCRACQCSRAADRLEGKAGA